MQLGIGALPQQEVGQPLFAAGADHEVDVAQPGLAGDERGKIFAAEMDDFSLEFLNIAERNFT